MWFINIPTLEPTQLDWNQHICDPEGLRKIRKENLIRHRCLLILLLKHTFILVARHYVLLAAINGGWQIASFMPELLLRAVLF